MPNETKFSIDQDIPVPERRTSVTKYPFAKMNVGDSFAVPANTFSRAVRAAYAYGARHRIKFSCSSASSRIWRAE